MAIEDETVQGVLGESDSPLTQLLCKIIRQCDANEKAIAELTERVENTADDNALHYAAHDVCKCNPQDIAELRYDVEANVIRISLMEKAVADLAGGVEALELEDKRQIEWNQGEEKADVNFKKRLDVLEKYIRDLDKYADDCIDGEDGQFPTLGKLYVGRWEYKLCDDPGRTKAQGNRQSWIGYGWCSKDHPRTEAALDEIDRLQYEVSYYKALAKDCLYIDPPTARRKRNENRQS